MNNKKYPISVASYSFHGLLKEKKIDVFSYLQALRYRYNVDYADIWNGFFYKVIDFDLFKKVRKAMDDLGIELANLCVDGPHIWDNDEAVRAKNYGEAFEYMKAGEILGAKTVRIDMGARDEGDIPEEKFEYIVKVYRELAEFAGDRGMRIGTENHWGSSRYPHNLQRVRDAVNHPAYGHLFHFGNFTDVNLGMETAVPMAMHTHISAESVPYAKEYIRRLVNAGYKGTFSVEHHSGQFEYERVAWQLATVRGLITELCAEGFDKPAEPAYFNNIYKSVAVKNLENPILGM